MQFGKTLQVRSRILYALSSLWASPHVPRVTRGLAGTTPDDVSVQLTPMDKRRLSRSTYRHSIEIGSIRGSAKYKSRVYRRDNSREY